MGTPRRQWDIPKDAAGGLFLALFLEPIGQVSKKPDPLSFE